MTTDQLRTGAALVRALVDGDDTARGPLSDWILENGIPGDDRRNRDAHMAHAVYACRLSGGGGWCAGLGSSVRAWARYIGPNGCYDCCWLGDWPAWAWKGQEVAR